jgi:hypothetical protein
LNTAAESLSAFEGMENIHGTNVNGAYEGITAVAEDEDSLHVYDGEGLGIDEEEGDTEDATIGIPATEIDGDNNIKPVSMPPWFKALFEEKVEFLKSQTKKPGQSDLYSIHKTFWLPKHTTFFNLQSANPFQLSPTLAFEPVFFYWDPQSILGELQCPLCHAAKLNHHGFIDQPRRCIQLNQSFWIIGTRYRCTSCKSGKGNSVATFNSYDPRIIAMLPAELQLEFPAIMTYHSAIDQNIFALMRSCFQNGMGAKQFSDTVRSLHLRQYERLQMQWLSTAYSHGAQELGSLADWPKFEDHTGYAGHCPSARWLRDLYDNYIEQERPAMDQYTAIQPCRVLGIDHSHKVTKHMIQLNGEELFMGLLSATNEHGQLCAAVLVGTKAHSQFDTALKALGESLALYGHPPPEVAYTDDMKDKGMLEDVFPSLRAGVVPISKHSNLPSFELPTSINVILVKTHDHAKNTLLSIMADLAPHDTKSTLAVGFDME